MNIPAPEKMNKNKELADKICDIVAEWMDELVVAQGRYRNTGYTDIRGNDITNDQWLVLQSRIERPLEE